MLVIDFFFKMDVLAQPPVLSPVDVMCPQIIVFVMGGITFEESTKIAEFNASLSSGQVLLGGSCIHNSTSFLAELSRSYAPDASIQHSFEISM